jgi:hypothetical protein
MSAGVCDACGETGELAEVDNGNDVPWRCCTRCIRVAAQMELGNFVGQLPRDELDDDDDW